MILKLLENLCKEIDENPNISPELRKISNFFKALKKAKLDEIKDKKHPEHQVYQGFLEILDDDLNTVEEIEYEGLRYASIFLAYIVLVEDGGERALLLKSLLELHTKYMSGAPGKGGFEHSSSSNNILPAINPVIIARSRDDVFLFLQENNLLSPELPLDGLIVATEDQATQENIHIMFEFYLMTNFTNEERIWILTALFLDPNCTNNIAELCKYNQAAAMTVSNNILYHPELKQELYPIIYKMMRLLPKDKSDILFERLTNDWSNEVKTFLLNLLVGQSGSLASLINTSLSLTQANIISQSLRVNKTVSTLLINNITVEDGVIKAIADALKTNNRLTELRLDYNNIGYEEARAFAEALKVNDTLTSLHLRRGNIGPEEVRVITEALKVNKGLTYLDLSNNNIEDEGAAIIAEAFQTNIKLNHLNLSSNNIGREGAATIFNYVFPTKRATSFTCTIFTRGQQAQINKKMGSRNDESFLEKYLRNRNKKTNNLN